MHRQRSERRAEQVHRPIDRPQLDLRQAAILVIRVEDVAENAAQSLRRGVAGVQRNLSAAGDARKAERPHVVEPENVVGVAVGVKHRVDLANALADGLLAKVGRGVDEHGVPVPLHHDRGPRAAVMRIGRRAHRGSRSRWWARPSRCRCPAP